MLLSDLTLFNFDLYCEMDSKIIVLLVQMTKSQFLILSPLDN